MQGSEYVLPLSGVQFLCDCPASMVDEFLPFIKEPLKLAEKLKKIMGNEERRAFLHYLNIVPKMREKFCFGVDLICDRLAFEQSTAADISGWKAQLWPVGSKLKDLCCGMGGDSFCLPESIKCDGVDIEPARALMFNENMKRLGFAHRASVMNALDSSGDFFCIDPARREGLNPAFADILELAKRFAGGMVKLPPAFPEDELLKHGKIVYMGNNSDCRECLLLLGEIAEKFEHSVNAVAITKAGVLVWGGEQGVSLEVESPAAYLLEPNPVLVRSHLFLAEGKKHNCKQIDSSLAYLSCDVLPPVESGFTAFKVIDMSGLSDSAVKSMLRKHSAGKITLKKRGVDVVPEKEIQRLSPSGTEEYILFYTRVKGKKVAILTVKA